MEGKDQDGKQVMPSFEEYLEQFKDAEGGFDGGDGQVGVVGDGSNAMEEFDQRGIVDNTVGGRGQVSGASKTNRIDKRWGQWGSDDLNVTQELKEQGMVQYDVLTGEDLRKVQRQQYENWFKQQKVWQQERAMRDQMEALDGKRRQGAAGGQATTDYQSLLNSGLKSDSLTNEELENVIFATGAKGFDNTEILRKKDWGPVQPMRKRQHVVDGSYQIKGEGLVSVMLEPNSMVAEEYIARFTPDTPPEFVVATTSYDLGGREATGQLPRRGTPFEFTVRFSPKERVGPPKKATLVVDTIDWKWTYEIVGSV
jgi:hypothetical protein